MLKEPLLPNTFCINEKLILTDTNLHNVCMWWKCILRYWKAKI